MNITNEDLIIAYRKAKVDAFYETGHLTSLLFAEYENNLFDNLLELKQKLTINSHEIFDQAFTGGHTFILKSIDITRPSISNSKSGIGFISNSKRRWDLNHTSPYAIHAIN